MKHLFHHVCRTFSVVDDRSCCKKSGVPVIRVIQDALPGTLPECLLLGGCWTAALGWNPSPKALKGPTASKVHKRHTFNYEQISSVSLEESSCLKYPYDTLYFLSGVHTWVTLSIFCPFSSSTVSDWYVKHDSHCENYPKMERNHTNLPTEF